MLLAKAQQAGVESLVHARKARQLDARQGAKDDEESARRQRRHALKQLLISLLFCCLLFGCLDTQQLCEAVDGSSVCSLGLRRSCRSPRHFRLQPRLLAGAAIVTASIHSVALVSRSVVLR
jgi:hypothetical protein